MCIVRTCSPSRSTGRDQRDGGGQQRDAEADRAPARRLVAPGVQDGLVAPVGAGRGARVAEADAVDARAAARAARSARVERPRAVDGGAHVRAVSQRRQRSAWARRRRCGLAGARAPVGAA